MARHKDHPGKANVLSPIDRGYKSLAVLAYEMIREGIVSGRFAPGEWFRQEWLTQQLGVSHTPVRQALERLVAEGLAERVPHRGVRVPNVDEREMAEIHCLRLVLEPVIVRLAAINISAGQLDRLGAIIEESRSLVSLDDMATRRRLNREFHRLICTGSGSPMLERIYDVVWNKLPDWMFYEGLFRRPSYLESSQRRDDDQHGAILAALRDRNADLAARLCANHIEEAIKEDWEEVYKLPIQILEQKQRDMGL